MAFLTVADDDTLEGLDDLELAGLVAVFDVDGFAFDCVVLDWVALEFLVGETRGFLKTSSFAESFADSLAESLLEKAFSIE